MIATSPMPTPSPSLCARPPAWSRTPPASPRASPVSQSSSHSSPQPRSRLARCPRRRAKTDRLRHRGRPRRRGAAASLPLAYVRSLLFGRFLVSLPYLNTNGVLADDDDVGRAACSTRPSAWPTSLRRPPPGAAARAAVDHPAPVGQAGQQGPHAAGAARLPGPLWEGLDAKVRNQVRKGEKSGLTVSLGRRRAAGRVLRRLQPQHARPGHAGLRPVAVPPRPADLPRATPSSASCARREAGRGGPAAARPGRHRGAQRSCLRDLQPDLREHAACTGTCWSGPCSAGSRCSTSAAPPATAAPYRFKKQWGAKPEPATWQYYEREAGRPTCGRTTPATSG